MTSDGKNDREPAEMYDLGASGSTGADVRWRRHQALGSGRGFGMSGAWWKETIIALAFLASLLPAAPLSAAEVQPQLTGDTLIHDPSVIEAGGRFVAFGTGHEGPTHGAIRVKTSPDGLAWTDAGVIGSGPPAWATTALGFKPLNVWAPTISRRGATAFLYYCLSSFGDNASAIGLMTNTAFDPLKPREGWQDQGMVVMSKHGDDFNAIDPFRIDASDGRAWLAFGSFWSGIKLSELDPDTGKLMPRDAPFVAIASRHGGAIEAASILEHDGKFYLFVSFDQCCKGVASTYNIRVGRADRIEGPYRDMDGKAMMDGGGMLVLATDGRFIGPGGQEAVKTSRGDWLAYHYYDGGAFGASKLQFSPILWTADGWPELGPLPQ
jgi:arabinan endo-1,5-alpha-L-arabinosidase